MPSVGADPDNRPAQHMFSALQTTHQHADTKAGILAAAQAALVGTAGSWSGRALHTAERGGAAGVLAGTLLVLFLCGLFGGAAFLAATLRPRLLHSADANRYGFVHLATGPDILPSGGTGGEEASERQELSRTIRFLARVAVRKYRCLTAAVVCTAVMGVSAGLLVVLRPLLS
ncbi:Pycsar system effector family protein [Streptomyces sp. NPDC001795]|uniref:Pycsar system effector family protein n=1 Tax=unclassified Streptomyces TaxID=2593676 RepID=UPI00331BA7F4